MSDPLAIKSSNVTAESPIHIYLNRRELIATIKNSVKCIEANAPTLDTTPAAVADTVHLLTQRAQFLTWLRAQDGDKLYAALYSRRRRRRSLAEQCSRGPTTRHAKGG
jgi:hypothetical protein